MQRLLVIEDESDIADLLRHVFSKEGFQVGVARDGAAALERYAESPPNSWSWIGCSRSYPESTS
jgi:two-component system response regulator BaeR